MGSALDAILILMLWSLCSLRVILGLILPGAAITVTLLGLYGYAAWNPRSRRHLDRVSFRLLVYALVAQCAYYSLRWHVTNLTHQPDDPYKLDNKAVRQASRAN